VGAASPAAAAGAPLRGTDRVFVDEEDDTVARGLKAVRQMRRRRLAAAAEVAGDAAGIEGRNGRVRLDTGEVYIRKPALHSALLRGTRKRVDHVQRAGPAPLGGVYTGRRNADRARQTRRRGGEALWAASAGAAAAGGGALEDVSDAESVRAIPDDDTVMAGGRVENGGDDVDAAMAGLAVGVAEAEVRVLQGDVKAPLSRRLLPSGGSSMEQQRRRALEARQGERKAAEAERLRLMRRTMLGRSELGWDVAAGAGKGGGLLGIGGAGTASGARRLTGGPRSAAEAKAAAMRMSGAEGAARSSPGGGRLGRQDAAAKHEQGDGPTQPSFGPLHMAGGLPGSQSLMELSRFDMLDDVPGRGLTRELKKAVSAAEEVRQRRAAMQLARPARQKGSAYGVLDERKEAARLTRFGRFAVPEEPHKYVDFDPANAVPTVDM